MTHPTTNWRKALKDFAADYLVPVAGMFVLVLVGLGILGVTGWVLRWIALPMIVVLVVLGAVAILTSEMVWRLSTFNAVAGLIATYYAVHALVNEFVPTLVGVLLGIVVVMGLFLYANDPAKAQAKEKQTLTDPTGRSHQVIVLSGNELDVPMVVGALKGLALVIVCWLLRSYGMWEFLWGLLATLALGRAIAWISLEADTQTLYFWHPFPFLREMPGFAQLFAWWHQVRRLLGVGVAHWAQE
ncbi:MAG: hypothetical protein IMHGJWDQ_002036 [Candidatus Fervidibacter sp.]